MREKIIVAEGVRKSFGHAEVLQGIDFTVERGEVACIIGPSGSGKSTFLRCLNALERIDDGVIRVNGETVGYTRREDRFHEWRPKDFARFRRDIGMVFQRFNLSNNMNALDNVGCAQVKVKGMSRAHAIENAHYQLERVGMREHAHRHTSQL